MQTGATGNTRPRPSTGVQFAELPEHLRRMALFKVNTGTREEEVCALQWDWEVEVPEIDARVFLISKGVVKNREERLVVLNDLALEVVESCRGMHPRYVFVYANENTGRTTRIERNHAWRKARLRAAIRRYEEQGGRLPPNLLMPIVRLSEKNRLAEAARRERLNRHAGADAGIRGRARA